MRRWTCLGSFVVVATLALIRPAVADDEDNWPMYGKNLQHTFANMGSRVTPNNVGTLQAAGLMRRGMR